MSIESKQQVASSGVADLDERRRAALTEIDNAKFSCVFILARASYPRAALTRAHTSTDGSM
jgi:hypothetical protein